MTEKIMEEKAPREAEAAGSAESPFTTTYRLAAMLQRHEMTYIFF